jgi:hypothetical protein
MLLSDRLRLSSSIDKLILPHILVLRGRAKQKDGENYTMRNFIICTVFTSLGSIVSDYGLDDRGSIPDRGRFFL